MKSLICILFIFIFIEVQAQCFQQISTGFEHTLIIDTDGQLWAWGSNNSGEIGINDGVQIVYIPHLVNSDNDWQNIFTGSQVSFSIKSNGTLWAWGDGTGGKLGLGNQNDFFTPTQVGSDTDWKYITSYTHTIAKKTDGTLWGWGNNAYGQLNLGTNSIELNPVQISAETNWSKIICGGNHTLAIKTNGTLWACGLNDSGQLGDGTTINKLTFVQIGTDNDWIEIAAGEEFSVALKSNGTIWGWGNNINNQLGYSLPSVIYAPTLISTETNWENLSVYGFVCGIKTDGTVWIFNGDIHELNSDTDWSNIYTGNSHIFTTKTDGSLWAYGNNSSGQLGLGSSISYTYTPTQLTCSSLSIENIVPNKQIIIYPNPTNNEILINSTNKIKIIKIILTDLTGKILFESKMNIPKIELNKYNNGLYILHIITENNGSGSFKVIKINTATNNGYK